MLPKITSRSSSIEIRFGRVHEEGICAYEEKESLQLKANETTHYKIVHRLYKISMLCGSIQRKWIFRHFASIYQCFSVCDLPACEVAALDTEERDSKEICIYRKSHVLIVSADHVVINTAH